MPHAYSTLPTYRRPVAIAVVAVCIAMPGCRIARNIAAPFTGSSEKVAESAKGIAADADATVKAADDWHAIAPSAEHHERIAQLQGQIASEAARLHNYSVTLRASEKECAKLRDDLAKERDKSRKWEDRLYGLLIIMGALGLVGAPVLAYFAAPKLAMLVALAAVTSIGVGMTMRAVAGFFADWGLWIGAGVGLLILLALGLTGWMMWRRAQREDAEAEAMAAQAREVKDPAKPADIDTFMEHWSAKMPLMKKALEKLEAAP